VNPQTVALIAPSLEILGGHATQAWALTHGLRNEGHHVLFVPINPSLPPGIRRFRRYRYVRTVVNEAWYLPTLLRLRPAILVARSLGKRVVLNYHSGEAPDHLARWGPLVHPWLRLADEIVVPSEYLRAVFARHGYRTRVICNIVDISRFGYRERRILRPRLLSTRNLEPYYQVDNTVKAFARLKGRYPDATLTVAGCGSEEGRLRGLAASLGVAGIQFVGRVEPHAMPRLYDEADIFVNSSVLDNQPVSVLEAFAAGLPVVSTGVGDLATLIRDGETGLIVPSGDPEAMTGAIVRLLGDHDRASAMARRARQEAERHTWPRVRQEWLAVYSGSKNAEAASDQVGLQR